MQNIFTHTLKLVIFATALSFFFDIECVPVDLTIPISEITPNTQNEEAILDQLQKITNLTEAQLLVLENFLLLDLDDQQIAINQMAALPYTAIFQIAELNTRKFLRRLYDPLRKTIVIDPKDQCGCINNILLGSWIDAGYDHTRINSKNCFDGYTWKGYDVSLGFQTSINPCWTIGVAGSYERNKINYQLGATGTNQTYLGGIYSLLRPADYYLMADLIFGYSNPTVKRAINIDSSHFVQKGKPEIYQGLAYFEIGHDLPVYGCYNKYLFQPFLGIEMDYFRYKSIRESSNDLFDIKISGTSHVIVNSRLGIHFTSEIFTDFTVAADAAWQHRCTSFDNHIHEHFVDFGDNFSITGANLSHDSFDGAINLSLALENNLRIYIEAAGQIWNNASTYNTFAGLQLGW